MAFRLDDVEFSFDTWSDTSALWAIHHLAKYPWPRRGCEFGQCGTCESLVDGTARRLCQMASTALDGCVIVAGRREWVR